MTQTRYAALLAFTIIMIETGLTQSAVPPIERTIPHPDGPPNPPMKCTIQIVAGGTAASAADLANVSKKLQDALDQSEDMQKKVDDACRAWSMTNGFMIRVFRGSMTIPGALARNGGPYIDLDLTDLEQMNGFMKGDPGVTGTFGANFLTATLAHEIDHMRDGPKREGLTHQDPDRNCADATRGPAVDDENKVMADMHFPIARLSYGGLTGLSVYRSKDDEKSPFAVFFYQDWLNHIAKLPPSTSTQTPAAGPAGPAGPPAAGPPGPAGPPAPPGPRAGPRPRRLFGFDDVPERACGPGASTGCFPPASTNDRDVDGTADSIDNCPALPNRQGDQNADGIGDACDRAFPRCGTSLFTR